MNCGTVPTTWIWHYEAKIPEQPVRKLFILSALFSIQLLHFSGSIWHAHACATRTIFVSSITEPTMVSRLLNYCIDGNGLSRLISIGNSSHGKKNFIGPWCALCLSGPHSCSTLSRYFISSTDILCCSRSLACGFFLPFNFFKLCLWVSIVLLGWTWHRKIVYARVLFILTLF